MTKADVVEVLPPTKPFELLVAFERKAVAAMRGWLRRGAHALRLLGFSGPRPEIAHDWRTVLHFAERAERRLDEGGGSPLERQTMATVKAYLEQARTETDFAEAWTYVNLADALLPLVVAEDERDACTVRLRILDGRVEDGLRALISSDSTIQEPRAKGSNGAKRGPTALQAHAAQLARAEVWNMMNRAMSLRLALWRSIERWLVAAIVALLAATYLLERSVATPALTTVELTAITLMGFFGGGLSAFVRARAVAVEIPSFQLVRMHTVLRMTLGAAGAMATYVIVRWLGPGMNLRIEPGSFGFYSLGVAAGFSERLFISALEKVSENLHLTGTTKRVEPGKRSGEGGSSPGTA